jgi:hypothetical protein
MKSVYFENLQKLINLVCRQNAQFLNVIVGCVYIGHFPLKGLVFYLQHIPHMLKIQAMLYKTYLMNINGENFNVS